MENINRKKVQQARDSIRYMNGSDITYNAIKAALDEVIEKYGIDAVVEEATLYGGSLFAKEESCLALVNPNHRNDYFKFCIVKKDAGELDETIRQLNEPDFNDSGESKDSPEVQK